MTTCTLVYGGWNPRSLAFSSPIRIAFKRSLHSKDTPIRPLFASIPLDDTLILTDKALRDGMRQAFDDAETDGILEFASTIQLKHYDLDNLLVSCMEAVDSSKGKAAGIINGWIGSCCLMDDKEQGATLAWKLLEAYDDNNMGLLPDIVTFSLVYSALVRTDQENFHVLANIVLERAEQLSKKEGGSKRRRALAASNRKNVGRPATLDLSPFGIQILQETPHWLALSKPSGMVCFHKKTTTAGKVTKSRRNKHGQDQEKGDGSHTHKIDISLQDALLNANIPLSTLNAECRGLVHRIDRGTSGCIVLAKTNDMHAKLVTEFFLRRAKKSYQALVVIPQDKILLDRGEINIKVNGRPAKSTFLVEERIYNYARLRVETYTGRKHQVRVHCAEGLECPILLDPLYVDDNVVYSKTLTDLIDDGQRFFLHASTLQSIDHGIDCEAPLPAWWQPVINMIAL